MGDHNMAARRTLLKQGKALPPKEPGGPPRFPINDRNDLTKALGLIGQAPASEQPKIRRYIIRRARALKAADAIPDNWRADGTTTS